MNNTLTEKWNSIECGTLSKIADGEYLQMNVKKTVIKYNFDVEKEKLRKLARSLNSQTR